MGWYRDASGKPVWVADGGQQGTPIGPQDPAAPFRGPAAASGIQAQQSNIQSDAINRARTGQQMQQDAAMLPPRIREAQASAALKEQQAAQAQTEAASKDPFNAQQIDSVATDAMSKLKTIDRIRQNDRSSLLPTIGFGADYTAGIGGTGAADIAADLETLKSGSALSEVLKMTQTTGKNPFTPMSNSDVNLIANNQGNLNQKQSRPNFNANLQNYQDAYTRAYAGAKGKQTLDGEIQRLLPTIPADQRDKFKADALRLYNQKMSRKSGLLGSSSRRPGAAAPKGWKVERIPD